MLSSMNQAQSLQSFLIYQTVSQTANLELADNCWSSPSCHITCNALTSGRSLETGRCQSSSPCYITHNAEWHLAGQSQRLSSKHYPWYGYQMGRYNKKLTISAATACLKVDNQELGINTNSWDFTSVRYPASRAHFPSTALGLPQFLTIPQKFPRQTVHVSHGLHELNAQIT